MPIENNYLIFNCDMNSGSTLRIIKQYDGDVVLRIDTPKGDFTQGGIGSIELCAPFTGGGRHDRLWKCLAMFFDKEMKDALKDDPMKYQLRTRAD